MSARVFDLRDRRFRMALVGTATLLVLMGFLVVTTRHTAEAHGSMQFPASRIYACFLEGPEHPQSPACQAAVALGGTQPLYDWNEVNIANAAGRHREIIPDGRLCSAGRDKYGAFDVAREDWPTTRLPSGGSLQFLYKATAPHRGHFELYVTRNGHDPRQPLRWSDLEANPFHVQSDPPLVEGAYVMDAKLPQNKTGHHVIYTIWQRSDSPEAFYSCADVIFGDGPVQSEVRAPTRAPGGVEIPAPAHEHSSAPDNGSPPEHSHSSMPADGPSPHETTPSQPSEAPVVRPGDTSAPPWQPHQMYVTGERVSFDGRVFVCRQGHTSLPNWQPDVVVALWLVAVDSAPGETTTWQPQVAYEVGDRVVHNGLTYRARQAHVSLPGWQPSNAPALWELEQEG